jgi:serine/threonine protein kinase
MVKFILVSFIILKDIIKNSKYETQFLVQQVFPSVEMSNNTLLALQYYSGGELYSKLKALRKSKDGLSKEVIKFYAANILVGLGQLHKLGIIYKE